MTSTATTAQPAPYRARRSGKQSITTSPDTSALSASDGRVERRRGRGRPQAGLAEGIGVQPPPVDLDPQELLQAYVAQAHAPAEVVEQGELAGLGGRLEGDQVQAEGVRQPVGQAPVEAARPVEQ